MVISATVSKKDAVYLLLKERIGTGEYPPAMRLPPEAEFAKTLGVSIITLRSALKKLEEEQLICRTRGRGTFVAERSMKGKVILILSSRQNAVHLGDNYIIPGIEAEAARNLLETEECFYEYLRTLPLDYGVKLLQNPRYCGIILLGSNYIGNEAELEMIRRARVPAVASSSMPDDMKDVIAALYTDTKSAWKAGLDYLISCGHRKIAVLGFHGRSTIRSWKETELLQEMVRCGLDLSVKRIFYSDPVPADVAPAVEEILSLPNRPTAIYCYSDFQAISVMDLLQKRHIRIPGDIAVMGFCGYPGDDFQIPPLSTVDRNYKKIGCAAVKMLLASPEWFGKTPAPELLLPYNVVERGSTRIRRENITLRDKILMDIVS